MTFFVVKLPDLLKSMVAKVFLGLAIPKDKVDLNVSFIRIDDFVGGFSFYLGLIFSIFG